MAGDFYGVAAAGAIVLTLEKCRFFTPWYANKVMGINKYAFSKSMLQGIFNTIALIIICFVIGYYFQVTSFMSLILIGSVISILYIIVIWRFCLSQFEKEIVISYIPKPIKDLI